jgi:uncharacterized membrane protein YdfJ with MMPL/SSD domain
MLMFAILFGLSMDYEVFLLSRVREQFASTATPTAPSWRVSARPAVSSRAPPSS